MANIAVIFAGGVGRRMHNRDLPKQFLEVDGKAIIIHTLEHFEQHPQIDAVVIACVKDWIPYLNQKIEEAGLRKVREVVPGGDTGQDSICAGLLAAERAAGGTGSDSRGKDIVLIHDGVRPLIDAEAISACIKSVQTTGSAITTAPLVETVIRVSETHTVEDVVDRDRCFVAKAPQCFFLQDILAMHRKAIEEGRHDFIDSATMAHYYGCELTVVSGPADNIKITTPKDYYTFKGLYNARKEEKEAGRQQAGLTEQKDA